MSDGNKIALKTPADTEAAAFALASRVRAPAIIALEGPLGAGKTTFVKGFLRGLGYDGLVKSPTYTIVETYPIGDRVVHHADLYRIEAISELEHMGFRDYLNDKTICIIEWASKAKAWLPTPTMICTLTIPGDGVGRVMTTTGVGM